ncbi:hypothetical protein CRUP_036227 [Coryphaenoides rupestris]|nr:hypothetical protein CRUP_036227 [Coryphaenoides rupestris]
MVRGQPRGVHRLESRRQQHQTQPHRWDQHRVRLRAEENQQFSEDPQGGGPRSVPMPGRQQTERVSLQRAHRGGAGGPGVQGGPAPLLEPGLVPTVQRHRRRPRLGGGEQQPVGAPVPLPAPAPAAPRPGRSVRRAGRQAQPGPAAGQRVAAGRGHVRLPGGEHQDAGEDLPAAHPEPQSPGAGEDRKQHDGPEGEHERHRGVDVRRGRHAPAQRGVDQEQPQRSGGLWRDSERAQPAADHPAGERGGRGSLHVHGLQQAGLRLLPGLPHHGRRSIGTRSIWSGGGGRRLWHRENHHVHDRRCQNAERGGHVQRVPRPDVRAEDPHPHRSPSQRGQPPGSLHQTGGTTHGDR